MEILNNPYFISNLHIKDSKLISFKCLAHDLEFIGKYI